MGDVLGLEGVNVAVDYGVVVVDSEVIVFAFEFDKFSAFLLKCFIECLVNCFIIHDLLI